MTPLISIIIPVYNVDAYIEECLESVLAQEHQNFEVILVDDGSQDKSGEICDAYVRRDKRFRCFHTENRGIGAARNAGLEDMKGDYCFFLDPDDVLETDSLSYLLHLAEGSDADVAVGVTRQFKGPYKKAEQYLPLETVYHGHTEICEKVLFDKNDLKPLERKQEPSSVTYEFFSCLYKTKIFRSNHVRFLPISYGEDTYVCFKALLNSETVATSTKVVYSHRRNPTSTTFQYHPFYLNETKEYHHYYLGLFEDYAPEYFEQAKAAIDGQYFRRCVAAIERELFMSLKTRAPREKIAVIKQIRGDTKFRELFSWSNMRFTQTGPLRMILYSIKLNIYPPVIWAVCKLREGK